jgi:hypothetical protein
MNQQYVHKRENIKKTPVDVAMESQETGPGFNHNLRKAIRDEYTQIRVESVLKHSPQCNPKHIVRFTEERTQERTREGLIQAEIQ